MTAFNPGASPPPVLIAILRIFDITPPQTTPAGHRRDAQRASGTLSVVSKLNNDASDLPRPISSATGVPVLELFHPLPSLLENRRLRNQRLASGNHALMTSDDMLKIGCTVRHAIDLMIFWRIHHAVDEGAELRLLNSGRRSIGQRHV